MERHLASCGAPGMRMQVSASPVVGVEPAVYAPKALLLPSQYGAPPLRSDEDDEAPYGTTARAPHLHVHPSAAAWARAADDDAPHHQQQQQGQQQGYGYADAGDRGAHESLHLMKADGAGQASIVDVDRKPRKPAKREIFVCPEVHCGKQFPRSFALRRHMRIHTGTKPYACDFEGCTQRFNTSGNLSRHKRIHSGERPYPCVFETCGKRFNTSTKLKRHMRIHFPDGQNLFQCVEPGCSWACDNYKEYVQHQRLHSSVAQGVKDDENVNRGNADFPPPSQPAQAAAKAAASRASAKRKASPKPPMASNARPGRPGGPSIADIADISADESSYGVNPMDAYSQQSQPPMGPTGLDFSGGEKDYYQDRNRSYPLMMMQQKEMPRDREDEYMSAPPQDSRRMKSYLDERPRLPFPTRAFPSEPIASASPSVQQGSVLGSSFHFHHMPPHRGPSYYEPSAPVSSGYGSSHTSSYGGGYSSYLRPSSENTMSSSYAPASNSYYQSESATLHFAPIRPEEPSDNEGDRYDSSPHSSQSMQQSIRGSAQGDGYSSSSNMNPAQAPEFTGEELSAVLELMKDS